MIKSPFVILVAALAIPSMAECGDAVPDLMDRFALQGEQNILDEAHFGIVNGQLAAGVDYKDIASIHGLWAPPYVSSDFRLAVALLGQTIATRDYRWLPFQVQRAGSVDRIEVTTSTPLIPGVRGGVLSIDLENLDSKALTVPMVVTLSGTLDRTRQWEFARPASRTATKATLYGPAISLEANDLAIVVQPVGTEIRWDAGACCGRGSIELAGRGRATVYLTFALDAKSKALDACGALAVNPVKAIAHARQSHLDRVRDLFQKLPRLEANNPSLVRFYNRSLVHFLMNRWDVAEFVLHPYYGTGSVCGGCVCNYLWNFGETWEILPLYDPRAAREHVQKFLQTDMTRHFAFNPVTGDAFGPWYPVNQEKILGLIYYYVRLTGDVSFLSERVDGKTVLEHAIAHAMHGDDLSRPVSLIDYGPANNHLELRRGYPYNHKMPDLNGRRYENYLMAARLAEAAGKPAPYLLERAQQLKTLLKQTLWNPKSRWFDFQDGNGRKDTRYTVQVFKLLGSRVLDAEQEAGLLSHLNETEFLSQFGLHSMSKTDVAYDQVDIDNGGGGCCTGFPPQIAERLYKAGRPVVADDILRRILWWGERMPYWGDSLVANAIEYRKDTPLQCTIDGVTAAQCIIFGLFGVTVEMNGDIVIDPRPSTLASSMKLCGLKLRGRTLDIAIQGDRYEVGMAGEQVTAKIGQAVRIRGNRFVSHFPVISVPVANALAEKCPGHPGGRDRIPYRTPD